MNGFLVSGRVLPVSSENSAMSPPRSNAIYLPSGETLGFSTQPPTSYAVTFLASRS